MSLVIPCCLVPTLPAQTITVCIILKWEGDYCSTLEYQFGEYAASWVLGVFIPPPYSVLQITHIISCCTLRTILITIGTLRNNFVINSYCHYAAGYTHLSLCLSLSVTQTCTLALWHLFKHIVSFLSSLESRSSSTPPLLCLRLWVLRILWCLGRSDKAEWLCNRLLISLILCLCVSISTSRSQLDSSPIPEEVGFLICFLHSLDASHIGAPTVF